MTTKRTTSARRALRRAIPIPGPAALAAGIVVLAAIGWVDDALKGGLL